MRAFSCAIALLITAFSCLGEALLIPRGSVWKYYYNGVVPTNWIQNSFDDRNWPSGRAQIGWGEGDEQTVPIDDPGFDPTLYFRKLFTLPTEPVSRLTLRIVADDGAVVYLNGIEVWRRNMPAGTPNFLTRATANVETNENVFAQFALPIYWLRPGTNCIAVELHQHASGGHDASFDLELLENLPQARPQVQITSPADGTIWNGGDLIVQAPAGDPEGHIVFVILSDNGEPLATLGDPFTFVWQNPPPGRHTLIASAYDNDYVNVDSELVHVQVGAGGPIQLERGPYLQMGSSTGMVVRWRTDWLAKGVIRFGTNLNNLDFAITNDAPTSEQKFQLTGLAPNTLYYYSAGSTEETFASGEDYYFRTAPTNDSAFRIWVIGDSGTADTNAANVRNAYEAYAAGQPAAVWLMLGDNAYGAGLESEFQKAVFEMYPEILRNTVLWPALGNHDAGESTIGTAFAYLRAFTFPVNGEAGGIASGTPFYYSFDHANAHFVCLDSFLADRSTNAPMWQWLRNDLAATQKDWIIAYWHHPPYSKGSHDSDYDPYQIEMRERFVPLLEEYGVDLVLTGHSHVYERSYLLHGHYGYSWDFEPQMALDSSWGRTNAGGAYAKPAGGLGNGRGTVYAVCGCSGEGNHGGFPLHPAMATNDGGYGSMILDIDGLRMDAKFLKQTGEILDYFTIDKTIPATNGPSLRIAQGSGSTRLTWPTSRPDFLLETSPQLTPPGWIAATNSPATIGRTREAIIDSRGTNTFFRLRSGAILQH
jgi:hypothetical protein